jgi:anti-sigma-K factor RskA
MEKTEKKLKQLFSELKAQDSQRVPAFNSVTRVSLQSTSTRWTLQHWRRFAIAVAAVAVLIGVIVAASFREHTQPVEKEMFGWAALSDWEAPTDALLSVSEMPWDDTTTAPSDFPANDVSSDSTTEKL